MKKECQQQSERRPRTPKGKNSEIVVLDVDATCNMITSFIWLLTAIVLTAVWLNEINENNYL